MSIIADHIKDEASVETALDGHQTTSHLDACKELLRRAGATDID